MTQQRKVDLSEYEYKEVSLLEELLAKPRRAKEEPSLVSEDPFSRRRSEEFLYDGRESRLPRQDVLVLCQQCGRRDCSWSRYEPAPF